MLEKTGTNHINAALAEEVKQEIAETAQALQASAEKPSAKVFRTGISFEEYVKAELGISIFVRIFLRKAFSAKDPASRLRHLLDTTPDAHFYPEIKSILNDFWERDYGKNS